MYTFVIPAQAGIQSWLFLLRGWRDVGRKSAGVLPYLAVYFNAMCPFSGWIPACAGMTANR